MSKKVMEEEDKKPSVLDRISNYLKSLKGANEAKAEDDEPDAKKADDEEEMSAKKEDDADNDADAAKKTDDEDAEAAKADDTDPDDDGNDDDDLDEDGDESDEDDIEVNGKAVNLKDPVASRTAIEELQAINAQQTEMLAEAAAELADKEAKIAKKTEEVKKEIKSTFVPTSSKRSHKIGEKESDKDIPDASRPPAGSYADRVLQSTLAKAKAAKKG